MNAATEHKDLVDSVDATYAIYYIENMRSGRTSQVGIVSGPVAIRMATESADPNRLVFQQMETPKNV